MISEACGELVLLRIELWERLGTEKRKVGEDEGSREDCGGGGVERMTRCYFYSG